MLTSKQRAYLRSLGNDAEVVLQVGKGSISDAIVKQADDALEALELVKMRVLKNCLESPSDIAAEIADATGSEVVQTIGRNALLYRKAKKPHIELPS
jgi:RNA-binding protein